METNCPRCNEPVCEFDEICGTCGCELEGTAFNDYQETSDDNELMQMLEKGLQICKIRFVSKSNDYTFVTVQRFEDDFINGFFDVYNEFYVFKSRLHPHLEIGKQIILKLNDLEHFYTDNRVKIWYLKEEMTIIDVTVLKTYSFNKG